MIGDVSFWTKMQEIAGALSPDGQRFFFLAQCIHENTIGLKGKTPDDRDLMFAAILGYCDQSKQLNDDECIQLVRNLRNEVKAKLQAWNEAHQFLNGL